jgi:phage gp29-like protein
MAAAAKKAAPVKKTAALDNKLVNQILAKSMSRVRQDVASWNTALTMARKAEKPKRFLLYNLYDEISIDGLLKSQLGNRNLKSLSTSFIISDKSGNTNEDATALLQDKIWVNEINKAILGSITHGHSAIELSWIGAGETQDLNCDLLDRQNIEPRDGLFYPDYNADKATAYRLMPEFGTWILEFGDPKNLGLLNSAVPHVLFKRFAQSCWSELCEIAGIPPRVMKTDTQNAAMLRRAERMMKDMGAAAWFIIDESEKFEWAQASNANGDVYQKLMTFCNNEISMLVSGAVMGQDTVNGSNSKEKTMQDTLQTLVDSDLSLIEQYWNSKVIPALINIGVLSGECVFSYPETEDIAQLWTMTKDTFQYFEVDTEWIKTTFGVQVTGPKIQPVAAPPAKLSLDAGFFD